MSRVATPRPTTALAHLSALRALRNLLAHRELIARLTVQEVRQRYQGSALGVLWSLITPALMLTVYTVVFSVIFQARWAVAGPAARPADFALVLFAGLIPFNVLAEVAGRAPSLVLATPSYVKRVVFPLEILPVVAVASAVAHSLIALAVLCVAQVALTGRMPATVALVPLAYAPLVLVALGVGWVLASLGVYLRDIGHVVGVATHVLLFLSPIFYPIEAVPEGLRAVIRANPLTTILDAFRRLVLWDMAPAWGPWGVVLALGAAIALLGYAWFMQTKKGFADVM